MERANSAGVPAMVIIAPELVMGVMSYKAVSAKDSAGQHGIPRPKPVEDRPTEDDIVREKLGGPKGSPDLEPAPLTRQEREQNLPNDDPGHVA
jgi:hypothetical protein